MSVLEFANIYVFKPLGIDVNTSIVFQNKEEQMEYYKAKNIEGWVSDLQGIHTAGWGLSLKTKDMAKIGQLYLDKGIYMGKQIVSSSWIKESTSVHSIWQETGLSYGYLWWILDPIEQIYAAMGDGGNVIYVNTKEHLVVSITSLLVKNVKDRITFIKEEIELRCRY